MEQQELSDLLEIGQLAARYMAFAARKEQERWSEIFAPDGIYSAFGASYSVDELPMLLNSAPPGQYIGNTPLVELDGDVATGVQHYVFIEQATHNMRLAWYTDEYVRTTSGWRIRSRSTTFMRRSGAFDAGKAHDPSRYVGGQLVDES